MEARTITVKGVGRAVSRPDQIMIPITLNAKELEYQKAMDMAAQQHEALKEALGKCGLLPKDVKTTDFQVSASYESERDKNGNYKRRFDGYACTHQLQIKFDMDMERLGQVLSAIAQSNVQPECSIQFGVKDSESMMREVLKNAAANARQKADILTEASGTELGELLHIDYSWADVALHSETRMMCTAQMADNAMMEIEPDDVSVSENVTFTWALR